MAVLEEDRTQFSVSPQPQPWSMKIDLNWIRGTMMKQRPGSLGRIALWWVAVL
jgi:hypothetical protein